MPEKPTFLPAAAFTHDFEEEKKMMVPPPRTDLERLPSRQIFKVLHGPKG